MEKIKEKEKEKPPNGAQYKHNELYYKIGIRKMLFVWIEDEWKRSSKSIIDVVNNKL